jgi:mannose-6-phosphate isomerase-like protein (cupin superfamily)
MDVTDEHPRPSHKTRKAGPPVRGVWTVNGKTFEGSAGDIFVIKAGEIHSFKAVGDSPLVQFDIHLSPRFIQENL